VSTGKYRISKLNLTYDPFGRGGSSGPLFISTAKAYGKIKILTKELEAKAMELAKKKVGKDASRDKLAKEYDKQLEKLIKEKTKQILRQPEIKEMLRDIGRRPFEEAYRVNLARAFTLYRQNERQKSGDTKPVESMPLDAVSTTEYKRSPTEEIAVTRIATPESGRITETSTRETIEPRITEEPRVVREVIEPISPRVTEPRITEPREPREPEPREPDERVIKEPDEREPIRPEPREPREPEERTPEEPRSEIPTPDDPVKRPFIPDFEFKDGIKSKNVKKGLVAWYQGKIGDKEQWYFGKWPYIDARDFVRYVTDEPLPYKVKKVIKGKGAAKRSYQLLIGKPPKTSVFIDMGIQDLELDPKLIATYTRDMRQITIGDVNVRNIITIGRNKRKGAKPVRASRQTLKQVKI